MSWSGFWASSVQEVDPVDARPIVSTRRSDDDVANATETPSVNGLVVDESRAAESGTRAARKEVSARDETNYTYPTVPGGSDGMAQARQDADRPNKGYYATQPTRKSGQHITDAIASDYRNVDILGGLTSLAEPRVVDVTPVITSSGYGDMNAAQQDAYTSNALGAAASWTSTFDWA